MSPAYDLPRCHGRLAHCWSRALKTVLAVLLLWPAAASVELSAAESALPSVGPARREQPRPADAMRTAGDVVAIATTVAWEPVSLVGADLHDALGVLQWAFESDERVAQNPADAADDAIVDEQVPVGQLERDPCYVNRPLTEVGVNISPPEGKLPEDVAWKCRDQTASLRDPRMDHGWAGFVKHWAATCYCHAPLYFEEVNAERYGYTCCGYWAQPFLSGGRFLVTIPALPYLMVARPPCECVYSLGHSRPGSCVPYRWHRPACCVGAGVIEAAVVVGLVALIP